RERQAGRVFGVEEVIGSGGAFDRVAAAAPPIGIAGQIHEVGEGGVEERRHVVREAERSRGVRYRVAGLAPCEERRSREEDGEEREEESFHKQKRLVAEPLVLMSDGRGKRT